MGVQREPAAGVDAVRIVAMLAQSSGPDGMDIRTHTPVQQNAYNYVDLTGGFFGLGGDNAAVARLKTDDDLLLLKELESHPVSRHIARWSSAPALVPGGGSTGGAQQPDGPIAGNGASLSFWATDGPAHARPLLRP